MYISCHCSIELALHKESNSGIIHPGTQNPPDSLKGKLCVEGHKITRELAKELGVDLGEVGELIVAFSESDVSKLDEIKKDAEVLEVDTDHSKDIIEQVFLQK